AAEGEGEASQPGRILLQLRPRFSYIDQTNKPKLAEAYNMRMLLGYRTAPTNGLQFTGQLVNVSWLHPLHANNRPGNSASPYPLVGDPDTTDLNLLFADYTGLPDTRVRIGRQAIKLDNERFVGDADVRQMPQVFDAVSARNTSFADTELYAAYAWQVRTYFGDSFRINTTLLNARKDFEAGMSVGAYGYFSDQPIIHQLTRMRDNSNSIVGARVEGRHYSNDKLSWYYTAERARQRPYADGDSRIRANYHRLAFGPTWGVFSAQVGEERLGSNSGLYAFQMPLSYNTFQGWAYEFFNTPRQGIRDRSVSLFAALGPLNLWLKFHRFDADYGPLEYGEERDFAVSYRIRESLSVRGVFASFRGNAVFFRPSAERYYMTLQYDY
ncbi:MAG: hypothetical protein EHM55_26180, partial [Acidobacteria bacterium]